MNEGFHGDTPVLSCFGERQPYPKAHIGRYRGILLQQAIPSKISVIRDVESVKKKEASRK